MSNEIKNLLHRCFSNKSLSKEEIIQKANEFKQRRLLTDSDYEDVLNFVNA